MRRTSVTLLVLALAAAPATGDVVHLHDGRTLGGTLRRQDAATWLLTQPGHGPVPIADVDIELIEVSAHAPFDPSAARLGLESLRRSAQRSDDPAKVVARYTRLIAGGGDPATIADAKRDLAVWQGRVDRHLVRLNDRWVDAAAREQAAVDSLMTASAARGLVQSGQFAAADPLVTAALAADPQDASALYLQGLLRYQQSQLNAARRAFEAADRLVPNHGPTLNNLAALDWRQHRYADALARYEAAMTADPADATVLDNVAAALSAVPQLPPVLARLPVVGQVRDHQRRLWAALADRLTKAGFHRFGTDWLTDAQFADVRRRQEADRAALDALTGQFDVAQDQVRQTDLAIADVRSRQRQSAGSGNVGPWLASDDGAAPGGNRPVVFYELQNDADQLQRRRATQVAHLDAIEKQAIALRQRIDGVAAPVQRLIGPDGTPVRLPPH